MPRAVSFLKLWLPVIIWMAAIFGFSTDAGSPGHTSRFIRPILRWLKPDISDEAIGRVQYIVRKGGHIAEYAILAALLWRALRRPARDGARRWRWSNAGLALGIAAAYAVTDEVHQSFVPSREGRVGDVLIDTGGVALGLLATWLLGRWRKLW